MFNADEAVLTDDARVRRLRELVAPADAVFLDAKIEAELQELDDESAAELLESIGQTETWPGCVGAGRFSHTAAADVPDRGAKRVARVDNSSG